MAVDDRDVRAEMARHAQPPDGSLAAQLGEYLQASTQDRFKAQAAPDGTPWAPLSERYQRRKKYNADKVLTLRGYLRSGIHYQKLDVNSVAVGTNSPYGGIHQFGGTIQQPARQATVRFRTVAGRVLFAGRKHKRATERQVSIAARTITMPARPYLGISQADADEIRQIVLDWIRGGQR